LRVNIKKTILKAIRGSMSTEFHVLLYHCIYNYITYNRLQERFPYVLSNRSLMRKKLINKGTRFASQTLAYCYIIAIFKRINESE